MAEQEMVKVYELAKELGMDSFSLLDKLNGLNIKVKSHMSELKPEEAELVRNALSGKKTAAAPAAGAVKKPAARPRKKAATPDAAPAAETPAAPTAAAASSAKDTSKSASPIIRRRGHGEGAEVRAAATPSQSPSGAGVEASHASMSGETEAYASRAATTDHLPPVEEMESSETPQATHSEMAAASASATAAPVSQTPSATASVSASAAAPSAGGAAPQTGLTSAPAAAGPSSPSVPVSGPNAPAGAVSAGAPATGPTTSSETRTQRPPIVLPPRPVAPRRSILKIVEPTALPPRPMIKPVTQPTPSTPRPSVKTGPGATGERDGFRIIKMTKENLDQMVEEEAAKKRGGGVKENEIRPEDVRFADYRKKEMVFLPKRKKIPLGKELKKTEKTVPKAAKRVVEMNETISVASLADQLGVKAPDVIRKLMGMGQMATINQALDFDTATLIAAEYQYEVKNIAFKEEEVIATAEDSAEQLLPRPPVVTIMGHVDHGKTSLLDAIREANVAGGEAGGITQHIGAYTVEKNGKLISFIDTPGHEAFTTMRARGANVTDIVILVVAADDGVMPQTREALSHAQAAGVPIIVAVNKIDKPGATPDRPKQQLAELNLLAEDWGGQTMFVPVSALKKTNLDKLLEAILLQAEVMDLRANPDALAAGTVLEARLEKGRGPVASVLIKRGTLRVGDSIVSGTMIGKVRALMDDRGRNVKEVTPGIAAEVLGFETLPNAGETFNAVEDDTAARKLVGNRLDKARSAAMATGKVSLEDLFSKVQAGAVKELNVVLKADVFGSVEAIRDSLQKTSTDKVKVKVIHQAPGGITESDVLLASASNAIIIGFNVRPETKARQLAESEHVEIKSYTIIYELIEDVKKAMAGLLDKKKVEKFLGRAEVRQTFSVPKIGMIAGSAVIDGKITRGANVRLLRDSRVIYEGKMSSLRRFKDDAKEVATGFECGIGLENYNDLKPGDVIEAFQIELITPELGA